MADEQNYTDAQLSDGTTLRFQGQLSPMDVKQRVTAYRAGLPSATSQAKADLPQPEGTDMLGNTTPETLPEKMAKLTPQQKDRFNEGTSMVVPETMLSLGTAVNPFLKAPLATVGKLASSAGTGLLGSMGGRFVARGLGAGPDVQTAAGYAGGLLGGIAGYHEPPASLKVGNFGINFSDALRPVGAARDAQETLGAFMNDGYKPYAPPVPVDPVAAAVKDRTAMYLPTRMPARAPIASPAASLPPDYSLSSSVRDTPFTLPPPSTESATATSPTSVQYVKSLGLGARSVTSGQATLPPEPGVSPSGVIVIPEPNDASGVPNNMGSVPRDQLLDLAQRLKAGAGTQLRSLGNDVIYLPRGSRQ